MNYYKKEGVSQSSIKIFLDSKEKYFYRFIQNNYTPKESDSLGFGRYYHTLVFQPELIKQKYVINSGFTIGGAMGVFIQEFYKVHVIAGLSEDKAKEIAYEKSEFKLSIDTIWKKFQDTEDPKNINNLIYYKYLKSTNGKESISKEDASKAEQMYQLLLSDEEVMKIISPEDIMGNNIETYNELEIDWLVTYSRLKLKSMLDRVVVNHNKKTITIVDLKTTKCSNIKSFSYDMKNYKYYIQAIFYTNALEYLISVDPSWNKYLDYKIEFIFIPQYTELPYNMLRPVRLSTNDLEKGYEEYRNALIELEACMDTNVWKSDDVHTDMEGIITLNLFKNDNNNS